MARLFRRCRSRVLLWALATLGLWGCVPGAHRPAALAQATAVRAAWVQLGPGGVATARAVADRSRCPEMVVEGRPREMRVRAAPVPLRFPGATCEADLPPGASSASVNGIPLPLPRTNPTRIEVIGDTGCRVKGKRAQACNDPKEWPLAWIARSAAAFRPDLVIHVGDYLYREGPCPEGNAGCAGSPHGDHWLAWEADFFGPLGPLLRAAPWIMVRGNHELCSRKGGTGWFRFLDPYPATNACPDMTPPYVISLGALRLVVLDSAVASDHPTPQEIAAYRRHLATVEDLARGGAWLLTHRPLWAATNLSKKPKEEKLYPSNATLQAALAGRAPAGVSLILSGHVHLFEALGFHGGLPPQLVVGNSGTQLNAPILSDLAGRTLGGALVASAVVQRSFGFATLEPGVQGWTLFLRDVDGRPTRRFEIQGNRLRLVAE